MAETTAPKILSAQFNGPDSAHKTLSAAFEEASAIPATVTVAQTAALERDETLALAALYREAHIAGTSTETTLYTEAQKALIKLQADIQTHPAFQNLSALQQAGFSEFTSPFAALGEQLHEHAVMMMGDAIVYTDEQGTFVTDAQGLRQNLAPETLSNLDGQPINKPADMSNPDQLERLVIASNFEAENGARDTITLERLKAAQTEYTAQAETALATIKTQNPDFAQTLHAQTQTLEQVWDKQYALQDTADNTPMPNAPERL